MVTSVCSVRITPSFEASLIYMSLRPVRAALTLHVESDGA